MVEARSGTLARAIGLSAFFHSRGGLGTFHYLAGASPCGCARLGVATVFCRAFFGCGSSFVVLCMETCLASRINLQLSALADQRGYVVAIWLSASRAFSCFTPVDLSRPTGSGSPCGRFVFLFDPFSGARIF